jgi:signal transduction histidine kinase
MPVEVVGWPPDDGTVRVEVLDRGPGIDPAEAERLFDPFYRSAAARARGSGAGLGLAAARRLARAMGASLTAHEREGGGARFALGLPVATPDDELDTPPAP